MPEGRSQASADDIKVTPEMVDTERCRQVSIASFNPHFPDAAAFW
jgi:hypothetical protein